MRVRRNTGRLPAGAVARFGTLRLRHPGEANAIAFHPDSSLLASAGGLGDPVHVWDVKTGQEVERFRGKVRGEVMAFSADGKLLFTGSRKGVLEHWDVATGKRLHQFTPKEAPFGLFLAFSADASLFAVRPYGGKPLLFDVATGKQLPPLEATGEIDGMSLSPDGKLVTTTGASRIVRVWDARSGKQGGGIEVPSRRGAVHDVRHRLALGLVGGSAALPVVGIGGEPR